MGQSEATTYHTYREILSQFEAWRGVIRECEAKSADLRAIWNAKPFQEVVFTGCGSTYYLSRAAREIFQGRTGLPAQAYPASDLLLFPEICLYPGRTRLLVPISRSGETTETLRAIERFRSRDSNPVIAITCYEESGLAQIATLALVARQAHEQSVAQTRSFAAMLVGVQCLAAILAGDP
jgi:glucosamine--fructose-6-phosphate aminotransferase (isomerizing)